MRLGITLAGYGIAALFLWLLLNARQELGEIQEQCNTRIAEGVAEAQKVVREAQQAAFQRRLRELERQTHRANKGRETADAARFAAEQQARSVQMEVDRLIEEARRNGTATISQKCLSVDVDESVLRELR